MEDNTADNTMHTSAENGTTPDNPTPANAVPNNPVSDIPVPVNPVPHNDAGEAAATTGRETLIDIETGEILVTVQPTAFAAFYEAERATLVRALSLALHDNDFGTEAADEAFVRACQNWSSIGTHANPAGWVYRVGLNWAHSALRKRRRHRAKAALFARSESTSDRTPDIDLQRALAQLSDAHRSVVVCRYYLDFSVTDTADALGVPVGTIKSRLARAIEQLEMLLTSKDNPYATSPTPRTGDPT